MTKMMVGPGIITKTIAARIKAIQISMLTKSSKTELTFSFTGRAEGRRKLFECYLFPSKHNFLKKRHNPPGQSESYGYSQGVSPFTYL